MPPRPWCAPPPIASRPPSPENTIAYGVHGGGIVRSVARGPRPRAACAIVRASVGSLPNAKPWYARPREPLETDRFGGNRRSQRGERSVALRRLLSRRQSLRRGP